MVLMDRNTAAEEFAKMLFQVGVKESLEGFYDSLDTPGGQNKKTWEDVRKWHENETDEVRRFVRFIVKEAIVLSVHGLAVNLDGASGYNYVGEHPIEYAVTMRTYQSIDAIENHSPRETIEICPTTHGEDVHDIFLYFVDQAEEAEFGNR